MEKHLGRIQTLDRAFYLLEIIAEENEPLTLKDITGKSALPKPTVYRILSSLETWGYVEQEENKGYQLGTKLLSLGSKVKERLKIPKAAHPFLKELNETTKETVFLGVMDKGRSLYIAKLDSHHSVRLASGVGSRNYLHCTSLGKCLLSGISKEEITAIAREHGLPQRTASTITSLELLIDAIDEVNIKGYAIDDGENEEGVRCVAAPIRNHLGKIVAAVSISGPVQRIRKEVINTELLPALLKAADKISKALGYIDHEN